MTKNWHGTCILVSNLTSKAIWLKFYVNVLLTILSETVTHRIHSNHLIYPPVSFLDEKCCCKTLLWFCWSKYADGYNMALWGEFKRWLQWWRGRGTLTGEDPLLRRLRGLDVGALRGDRPVDGRWPSEPDDDRLESDHVAGAWVPGWWHQVRVVRLVYGSAVSLESDAPRGCPTNAVVYLARVRTK